MKFSTERTVTPVGRSIVLPPFWKAGSDSRPSHTVDRCGARGLAIVGATLRQALLESNDPMRKPPPSRVTAELSERRVGHRRFSAGARQNEGRASCDSFESFVLILNLHPEKISPRSIPQSAERFGIVEDFRRIRKQRAVPEIGVASIQHAHLLAGVVVERRAAFIFPIQLHDDAGPMNA